MSSDQSRKGNYSPVSCNNTLPPVRPEAGFRARRAKEKGGGVITGFQIWAVTGRIGRPPAGRGKHAAAGIIFGSEIVDTPAAGRPDFPQAAAGNTKIQKNLLRGAFGAAKP